MDARFVLLLELPYLDCKDSDFHQMAAKTHVTVTLCCLGCHSLLPSSGHLCLCSLDIRSPIICLDQSHLNTSQFNDFFTARFIFQIVMPTNCPLIFLFQNSVIFWASKIMLCMQFIYMFLDNAYLLEKLVLATEKHHNSI